MGNKMTSETLAEGFVDSKLSQTQNPCTKILEEMDSVSLCNLSNKCTADANNGGHPDVNDVELCNGSIRESMVCDGIVGNNEFNKGCSSNNYPIDDKLSVLENVDETNNNDVPNLGGGLKLSGNVGFQIGKVEDCAENSDDVSLSRESSPPNKIEISGNGVNLFVEIFGPLDGISESNSNLNGEGKECSFVKSGNISRVESSNFKNEGEKSVGEQECMFDVGDLVWVKSRTPIWWPGMISDPSNASNDETKPEKKGSFLVKYFGNANFIWCNNSDIKPFIEYYEQLSGQNTSRSFYGSMERALCEIGRRVKSKMTCPCFLKENENSEENLMPVDKKGKIDDVLSLSRFEPAAFLSCIKQFASSSYPPSKIELTVMKNHLSLFYRSIGHRELPLQMLSEIKYEGCNNNIISGGREKSVRAKKKRNPSDYDDLASGDKTASRERKKSKFLSYPFIDATNKEQETGSCNVKKSKKKGSGKSLKGHHIIRKADDINASSSELLAELHSTACDYFYLRGSKYSDSLRRFYRSFRSYAFLDADRADKDGEAQQAAKCEKRSLKKSSNETKRKKKGIKAVKESENPSLNLESVKESVDNNSVGKKISKKFNPIAKGSVLSTSAEKKEERVMSAGLESKKNKYRNISRMISFQKTCSNLPKCKTTSKKRDEGNPGLPNDDPISTLPNLNKNNPVSVENVPLSEQKKEGLVSPNINSIDRPAFAFVSSYKDATGPTQNIPQFNIGIINDANQCPDGEFTTREAGGAAVIINSALGSFVQQPPRMEFFPKPEPRKRKRKEKTCEMASVIPDLNGNASDMNPLEKTTLPDGSIPLPESKPQQKRANKEEDPGGSLILNFAPGSDLASNETFVAMFARFGLLKESGVEVSNDSTVVQIAYQRTSDARFAFRSLEKSHSFGESLVSFNLNCVQAKKVEKKMRKQSFASVEACKMPAARRVETPDVTFMKQSVEMMKSTLEKMGDEISPEMRGKLENEIKVFLDKIGSMTGSSSSS